MSTVTGDEQLVGRRTREALVAFRRRTTALSRRADRFSRSRFRLGGLLGSNALDVGGTRRRILRPLDGGLVVDPTVGLDCEPVRALHRLEADWVRSGRLPVLVDEPGAGGVPLEGLPRVRLTVVVSDHAASAASAALVSVV